MTTIKELKHKRSELAKRIAGLAKAFKKNGDQWASDAMRETWESTNAEYDQVHDQIEVAAREKRFNAPINHQNIGLDDAGDGIVGGHRAPGSGGLRRVNARQRREYVVDSKGRKQPVLRAGDSMAAELHRRNPEAAEQCRGVRLGEYLRAAALGARTRAEKNALSGSIGSGGAFTLPAPLAAELVDHLRAKSRVMQAGAGTIRMDEGELSYAKLTSDPTPTWAGESALVADSDPTFGKITFKARTLRMHTRAPRELLEDSVNLNSKLPEVFARSLADELDRVALYGIGAGSGSGIEPLGVVNYPSINQVVMGANGAAIADYTPLLDAVEAIETDNADAPTTAIMHPRTKRAFGGLVDTTGQPLMRPKELEGLSFLTTTKASITETQGSASDASSIVLGGFSELIIALRSEVRVEVLMERYADHFEVGFLVWMRADTGSFHEQAFGKIVGVTPT